LVAKNQKFAMIQDMIRKNSISFVGGFILIVFALAAFSGMGVFWAAGAPDGAMAGCPFSHGSAMCAMNAIEHIATWKALFTALPQKSAALLAILIFIFAAAFSAPRRESPADKSLNAFRRFFLIFRPVFDYLREIFSRGILHPKIY